MCQTSPVLSTVETAQSRARLLERVNLLVFVVALVVYVAMLIVATYYTAWLLIVFVTCVVLAETLVFVFVRATLTHFTLLRECQPAAPTTQ